MPSTPEPLAGDLITAVERLGEAFDARGIRYALLGGLATMLRGRPRFTQAVDVLLDVPQVALPGLLDDLLVRGFSLDPQTVIGGRTTAPAGWRPNSDPADLGRASERRFPTAVRRPLGPTARLPGFGGWHLYSSLAARTSSQTVPCNSGIFSMRASTS